MGEKPDPYQHIRRAIQYPEHDPNWKTRVMTAYLKDSGTIKPKEPQP